MRIQFLSLVWPSAAAILIAVAYTGALYFKNRKDELDWRWRIILCTLRFLFVFLLCFLLFSPPIRMKRERMEKPVCYLAFDESASMRAALNEAYRKDLPDSGTFTPSDFSKMIHRNTDRLAMRLSKRFDVRTLGFGLSVKAAPDFSLQEPATDYAALFGHIKQACSGKDNVLTVIISDGNVNLGEEPLSAYRNLAFPCYTVAVGDTTQHPDLFIEEIFFNRYAFKGNLFPVQVRIGQKRCPQARSRLRLLKNGQTVQESEVVFEGKRELTVEWECMAEESGLQAYQVVLDAIKEEHDKGNNRRPFGVQVLENRQKILIIAHAPHPDISCLRQSLQQQEKYHTDLVLAKDLAPYLQHPSRLESYDLIVLHGLPSVAFPLTGLNEILNRKPLFYMITPSTQLSAFDKESSGVGGGRQSGSFVEAQGTVPALFGLFNVSEDDKRRWASFPPLWVPFASCSPVAGSQTILNQVIMQVATDAPLLWLFTQGNRRAGLLAGSGLWKWPLANYQETGDTESFKLLIDRVVQLLCEARPENNLMVRCPSAIRNTEKLQVMAELYNAAFEKTAQAEIRFTVTAHSSEAETDKSRNNLRYEFLFLPEGDHYRLDAGFLPEGDYRYEASTTVGEQTYKTAGGFSVSNPQLENLQQPTRPDLLRNLALTYNGGFFYAGSPANPQPDVWEELADAIESRNDLKPQLYTEDTYLSLLDKTPLLAVLLLLPCLEFLARRRFGNL